MAILIYRKELPIVRRQHSSCCPFVHDLSIDWYVSACVICVGGSDVPRIFDSLIHFCWANKCCSLVSQQSKFIEFQKCRISNGWGLKYRFGSPPHLKHRYGKYSASCDQCMTKIVNKSWTIWHAISNCKTNEIKPIQIGLGPTSAVISREFECAKRNRRPIVVVMIIEWIETQ